MTTSKVSAALAAVILGFTARQANADVIDVCGAEKADSVRLACFDREVASRRAAAIDAQKNGEANVAREGAPLHGASHEGRVSREHPKAFVARVTGMHRVSANEFAFELDNGQVWKQMEGAAGLEVHPQDSITITPGALGSFFLTTAHQQTIQVRLIR